jgi:hypothetical protein
MMNKTTNKTRAALFFATFALGSVIGTGIGMVAAPNARAETCQYSGTTDFNGKASIETRYKKTADTITSRTLLRFTASLFGFNIEYDFDDIDVLSAQDEQLRAVSVNSRYSINGKTNRLNWDHAQFHWSPNETHATRITALRPEDLSEKYATFAKYWEPSTFGSDWVADFQQIPLEERTDLDISGFDHTLQSMLYVAFVKTRRTDPKNGPIEFEPFFLGSKTGKPAAAIQADPVVSGNQVVWSTPLNIGGTETSDGKPAQLTVDLRTHALKAVHLVIHRDVITAQGNLVLQGCTP